jgi:putative membrane protein
METNRDPAAIDATRRTRLANERTELAWWRTGMTVFALALAVSRVIPELADISKRWPYVLAGIAFAAYGIALIVYGSVRRHTVDQALAKGDYPEPSGRDRAVLLAGGVLLGLVTILISIVG